MRVIHGAACVDVRCSDRQRRVQFFESFYGSEARKIFFHAQVGGKAKPRRRPAAEIREARFRANSFHFFKRCPGAVTRADQRAHACACDAVDGDFGFAKYTQDSDMRYSSSKAARKIQADARALPGLALLAAGKRTKFVLCRSKPAERAQGRCFFRHISMLGPSG